MVEENKREHRKESREHRVVKVTVFGGSKQAVFGASFAIAGIVRLFVTVTLTCITEQNRVSCCQPTFIATKCIIQIYTSA